MLNRLHKIASNEAWLMRPAEYSTMMKIIERMEDMPTREGFDACGEAVELPSMRVENGTAIIPINGVMLRGISMAEKVSGVVAMEDVERDIEWAANAPEVVRVILDIDSPGGMYNGTPELSDVIAKCRERKPMAAFTAGTMASAAYWTGVTAGQVYMSRSSDVGSIGVVLSWPDVSKAMEAKGIKIKVFSSGAYKGMTPEVELTDSQESYLKERVMKLADEFYSHVIGQRAGAQESAFDGRVFTATEALELGLVDGTARNINEVIEIMTLQEEVQALRTENNQLRAELKEVRADVAALTDIVTEQASSSEPELKAEEQQPDIKALVSQAVAEKLAEQRESLKAEAAQEFSKMIASAGQPAPIPEKLEENKPALKGLDLAIAAHKREAR